MSDLSLRFPCNDQMDRVNKWSLLTLGGSQHSKIKKALGPIIMLNCIQPQGWNESDFFLARTGLLGLTASKSVRASSFL